MTGGSPIAQTIKTVNYFDPGRVLVRPPEFMNVQVLNENGNTGIAIDDKLTEFGAFIGSREYQLGQFADFDATQLKIWYAHTGERTCLEATTLSFTSPTFKNLKPPHKTADEFDARVGAQGRVAFSLSGDQLIVQIPPLCMTKPTSQIGAIIKLVY